MSVIMGKGTFGIYMRSRMVITLPSSTIVYLWAVNETNYNEMGCDVASEMENNTQV